MSELRALIEALVRIDSVNPALDPAHEGETQLARFVAAWGRQRGLRVTWLESTPGRPTVLLEAGGPSPVAGGTVLLNAHLDTVGVTGMETPFEPREVGGRLYGRGVMDMKASLAACMLAVDRAQRWHDAGTLQGHVVVSAVADEEHDSIGTREAIEALDARGIVPDVAIVTEPTDLSLHVAHRGFATLDVTLKGRASHTSKPHEGVNALTHLGRLLHATERADRALRARAPHSLLAHGSWQAVLAQGGRELFTTPDLATVSLERRTLPGERAATEPEEEVRAWLRDLRDADPRVDGQVMTTVAREAFEVRTDDPVVTLLASAVASVLGQPPSQAGAPYWTDAALLAEHGIPTVLFGPSGGAIHQPGEWLDLASAGVVLEVLHLVVRQVAGAEKQTGSG